MLLKKINEQICENEVLDLPYNQDVGDYLQFKVFYGTFISRDSCLIFRRYTSLAIIFNNNNTADIVFLLQYQVTI